MRQRALHELMQRTSFLHLAHEKYSGSRSMNIYYCYIKESTLIRRKQYETMRFRNYEHGYSDMAYEYSTLLYYRQAHHLS